MCICACVCMIGAQTVAQVLRFTDYSCAIGVEGEKDKLCNGRPKWLFVSFFFCVYGGCTYVCVYFLFVHMCVCIFLFLVCMVDVHMCVCV